MNTTGLCLSSRVFEWAYNELCATILNFRFFFQICHIWESITSKVSRGGKSNTLCPKELEVPFIYTRPTKPELCNPENYKPWNRFIEISAGCYKTYLSWLAPIVPYFSCFIHKAPLLPAHRLRAEDATLTVSFIIGCIPPARARVRTLAKTLNWDDIFAFHIFVACIHWASSSNS